MNDFARKAIALSTIPGLWLGAKPLRVAESLTISLSMVLEVELAFVAFRGPHLDIVSYGALSGEPMESGLHDYLMHRLQNSCQQNDLREPILLSEENKFAKLKAIVRPLGYQGEHGYLMIASQAPSFPTEEQLQLLTIAGNQAMTAAQNASLLEEVKRASSAKDEFLARVSHELRTPLTPVLMNLSLLKRDPLSPLGKNALKKIEANLQLEVRLINDLLDWNRVTYNKLELELDDVSLHEVLQSAWQNCCPALQKEKGIQVHFKLEAKPDVLEGDKARLMQVFWNLYSNAVRFTPPGGSVSIATARKDNGIQVRITDSGIGMDAELQKNLFKSFVQGRTIPEHSGLGLGLVIARSILKQHGASIRCESPGPGQGTTFELLFPPSEKQRSLETNPAVD